MIALKDIYKVVCQFLKKQTGVKVIDSDFDEPIVRPSFRVFMDTVKSGHFSSTLQNLNVFFEMYFYAKDGKFENMDIQDKISRGFLYPLEINKKTVVYINDLEFEKLKYDILNISFNFEIGFEFIDESDVEAMEKLQQK